MPDSYDAALAQTATRKRIDPRMQALIADMMTPEGHPASAPKPIVPPSQPIDGPGFFKQPQRAVTGSIRDAVNTHLTAQGHTPPGVLAEAYRAVAGGLRDAANQTVNVIDKGVTWLNNNAIDTRPDSPTFGNVGVSNIKQQAAQLQDAVPKVEENETGVGKAARGVVSTAAGLAAPTAAAVRLGAMRNMGTATAVAGAPLASALYGASLDQRGKREEERKRIQALRQRALQAREYGDQ